MTSSLRASFDRIVTAQSVLLVRVRATSLAPVTLFDVAAHRYAQFATGAEAEQFWRELPGTWLVEESYACPFECVATSLWRTDVVLGGAGFAITVEGDVATVDVIEVGWPKCLFVQSARAAVNTARSCSV